MIKHSFLLVSIFTLISTLSCNPLDTEIPGLFEEKTPVTLEKLIQKVVVHTRGVLSVFTYFKMAETNTELEIVNALRKDLRSFALSSEHTLFVDALTGLPAEDFTVEGQVKTWNREHCKYSDDEAHDAEDIGVEITDSDADACAAFLAKEALLDELLEIAESHFSLLEPTSFRSSLSSSTSPMSLASSVSPVDFSPKAPSRRTSPPAGSPPSMVNKLRLTVAYCPAPISPVPRPKRSELKSPLNPSRAVIRLSPTISPTPDSAD